MRFGRALALLLLLLSIPAAAQEGSADAAPPAPTMTIDVGLMGAQVLQAWDLNAAQLVDVRAETHPDRPTAYAWRIERLHAGSVLDQLGFVQDDLVLAINGSPTADHTRSADDLIAWFDAMLDVGTVSVEIERTGARTTLVFETVNVPQGAARQMLYGVLRRGYGTP